MMAGIWRSLKKWFFGWLKGGPHFVVGDPQRPYLLRWYILPRNPLCNIYVHKLLRDDDDRAAHDHPWHSLSLCLWRGYWEEVGPLRNPTRWIGPLSITPRPAWWTHRVVLKDGKPAWTLFLTGPRVRDWGFWCVGKGWVHWERFVSRHDTGQVGAGCDGEPSIPGKPVEGNRYVLEAEAEVEKVPVALPAEQTPDASKVIDLSERGSGV